MKKGRKPVALRAGFAIPGGWGRAGRDRGPKQREKIGILAVRRGFCRVSGCFFYREGAADPRVIFLHQKKPCIRDPVPGDIVITL